MHLQTKALVLRETAYKESDKILTLLTQEAGRLTASARGCRRKGSPIAAGSQLLVYRWQATSDLCCSGISD